MNNAGIFLKAFYYKIYIMVLATLLLSSCQNRPSQIVEQSLIPIPFEPLSNWQERRFAQPTAYSIIQQGDTNVLQAISKDSASMLYLRTRIDLNKTPYINWQWKISNTYNIKNENSRQGDDYPARIYIAINGRNGSLYPRALNYVWANHSQPLSHWLSPYSDSSVMLAIASGDDFANQWRGEKRNLKQDLLHYFNEDIDTIEGIAVMSDSDNSQAEATAFYRNLFFSRD